MRAIPRGQLSLRLMVEAPPRVLTPELRAALGSTVPPCRPNRHGSMINPQSLSMQWE